MLLQCFLTLNCLHFNRSEPIRGSPWSGCELHFLCVVANPQCLCWVSRAGEGAVGECAMSSYNWCCWRPGVSSDKMLPSDSEQNCRHKLKSAGVRCYCSQWRHQEFTWGLWKKSRSHCCRRRVSVTCVEMDIGCKQFTILQSCFTASSCTAYAHCGYVMKFSKPRQILSISVQGTMICS